MSGMREVGIGLGIAVLLMAVSAAIGSALGLAENLYGVLFLGCVAIGTIVCMILSDRVEERAGRHR